MFTQCPECKTVFEIAPADLAVAGGMVRCGECSRTFSALKSLAETPAEFEAADEPGARPASPASVQAVDDADEVRAGAASRAGVEAADHADQTPTGPESPAGDTDDEVRAGAASRAGVEAADHADETPTGPESPAADTDDEVRAGQASRADADTPDTAPEPGAQPMNGALAQIIAAAGASGEPDTAATDADVHREAGQESEVAVADAVVVDDTEPDSEQAATRRGDIVEEDDDDDDGAEEIVLDEFYEPDGSDDEEPIDDDDEWADAVAGEAGDERDLEPEPADAAALFSLPLPELHATGIVSLATAPEKLEGGEAAIDPFAQDTVGPRDDAAGPQQTAPASAPLPAPASVSDLRLNDAIDAEDARDLSHYLRAPRPGRLAATGWIGGSVLLALLLIFQIVHHHRGDLVVHPRFGPAVASLYAVIGVDVRPNWRVDDYTVVGEARLIRMPADDEDDTGPDALRFVAIIANRADRPQPPPMVRITLRDRWGDPRGARDFAPPEYLTDRSMVEQLLEPGQRLRVVLNLHDPGAEIDGFDFDMCLPDPRGRLRCSTRPPG